MQQLLIPQLPSQAPVRKKVCVSLNEQLLARFDNALSKTNLSRSHAIDFLMQTFIDQQG